MTSHPTEPSRRSEESGESAKRRQILEGARKVFLAQGFDGASMGEIAKVAGVSKGTLYVYFDSKESLFEALTTEEKRGLAEVLFKLDAEDPDVRGVLTKLGLSYLRRMGKPEHVSSIRMVIGAAEKFPRLGQAFYEAGPCQGIARLKRLFRPASGGRPALHRGYRRRRPAFPRSLRLRHPAPPALLGRRAADGRARSSATWRTRSGSSSRPMGRSDDRLAIRRAWPRLRAP